MAPPRVFHGARAKVSIFDPVLGTARLIGIWNSFDYAVTYDVQPSFILGRYSAAELTTTGVEPVVIHAQGWRVVDHDAFTEGRLSNIKDLLAEEYLVLSVIDRTTKKTVATIRGCRPTGESETASAKALQTLRMSYLGLLMDTETTTSSEASDASDLP
jgi:hypothetical protein